MLTTLTTERLRVTLLPTFHRAADWRPSLRRMSAWSHCDPGGHWSSAIRSEFLGFRFLVREQWTRMTQHVVWGVYSVYSLRSSTRGISNRGSRALCQLSANRSSPSYCRRHLWIGRNVVCIRSSWTVRFDTGQRGLRRAALHVVRFSIKPQNSIG